LITVEHKRAATRRDRHGFWLELGMRNRFEWYEGDM
jgi:hypothetical protein